MLFSLAGNAQGLQLSEYSQISMLTVGPGNSSIDCYGHSAIRVKDPMLQLDLVFNYGMYDFNTPNFYGKFAQGKLLYKVVHRPFRYFLEGYRRQNRTVTEQVLNLKKQERQAFFNYLMNNVKPENSGYLYDFFYNNCATKLRDVSKNVLKEKVVFNYAFTDGKNETLRDLIHNYSYTQPWGTFGIDLALGSVIDRKAIPKEYGFLPDYIFKLFKNSTINNQPLVKKTETLYKATPEKIGFIPKPLLVFSLLALLVIFITYKDYKNNKRTKILDFLLFFITGVVGILVLLLWLATDHSATAKNFNFLWAFPLNLIVSFVLFKKTKPSWLKKYITFLIALIGITLLLWVIGLQAFNIAILPLLIILLVRYFYLRKTI